MINQPKRSVRQASVKSPQSNSRKTVRTNSRHRTEHQNRAEDQKRTEDQERADFAGQIAAIRRSQAVIEFSLDGSILTANDNFLRAMGYTLAEVQGKHHSMFVDEAYRQSAEYRDFWASLGRGEYLAGEYRRIGKGGREVWIQGAYNPILDLNGRACKVVKYASDVTDQVNMRGNLRAILDQVTE